MADRKLSELSRLDATTADMAQVDMYAVDNSESSDDDKPKRVAFQPAFDRSLSQDEKYGRYPENPQAAGGARIQAYQTLHNDYFATTYDSTDFTNNNLTPGQVMMNPLSSGIRSVKIHLQDEDVTDVARMLEDASNIDSLLTIRHAGNSSINMLQGTVLGGTVNQESGNIHSFRVTQTDADTIADGTRVFISIQSSIDRRLIDRRSPLFEAILAPAATSSATNDLKIGERLPTAHHVTGLNNRGNPHIWIAESDNSPRIADYFTLESNRRDFTVHRTGVLSILGELGVQIPNGTKNGWWTIYVERARSGSSVHHIVGGSYIAQSDTRAARVPLTDYIKVQANDIVRIRSIHYGGNSPVNNAELFEGRLEIIWSTGE